jgi:A/G-specific adenine glycosylase
MLEHNLPTADWLARFRRKLAAWYARHARVLPWRENRDPYRVWLSEIMLQQTQVATVGPYFERFLKAFPTIRALAAADEHDVLRLWEGLGYYRRARQLHRAAQVIQQEHGGEFPRDPEVVRRLPGIGRYTAGAILSIAFDAREPILEANTLRLFSRLLAYRGDPASAVGQRLLWAFAQAVLPRRGVGAINQALMELGSEVCRPRGPCCDDCPVVSLCAAKAMGLVDTIPCMKPKAKPEARHEAAVIVRRRGRVLLLRGADGGRWAGLWDFPRFLVGGSAPHALFPELAENVQRLTGVTIAPGRHLKTLKHGVTRFRITLECFDAECVAAPRKNGNAESMRWLRPGDLAGYPLNSTGRQIADWV